MKYRKRRKQKSNCMIFKANVITTTLQWQLKQALEITGSVHASVMTKNRIYNRFIRSLLWLHAASLCYRCNCHVPSHTSLGSLNSAILEGKLPRILATVAAPIASCLNIIRKEILERLRLRLRPRSNYSLTPITLSINLFSLCDSRHFTYVQLEGMLAETLHS